VSRNHGTLFALSGMGGSISSEFHFLMERMKKIPSNRKRGKEKLLDLLKRIHDFAYVSKLPIPLEKGIRYILRKYRDPKLTTKLVAEKAGVSECQLRHLIKKFLGVECITLIHLIRIEKAKSLLMNRRILIKNTATRVGFENKNYFIRVFRKHEGMTPGEYRRRRLP